MFSEAPISIAEHVRIVGHLDDLDSEAQIELAASLAHWGDRNYVSRATTADELLEALALPDDTLEPWEQWHRELRADIALRDEVRNMLPACFVERAEAMRDRLRRRSVSWN